MVVDIAGLTNTVVKTAITLKAFDVVDKSVRRLDRSSSRKSKRKDFW